MDKLNFSIKLLIYPFTIMVSFGQTDREVLSALKKAQIYVEDDNIIRMDGVGRYCLFKGGESLIRLDRYPKTAQDYGSLAHEIFHAATYILDRIGMRLKIRTSDEAYAYLVGYITKEIYNKLQII